ncbi:MAG: Crp/Fnr family transcriptional regulator [Deltaproteobacteria bacterium]|nr:MAG: Crp/Fnr family transcriptional regulator [Deltaproteobacteria bacterium]
MSDGDQLFARFGKQCPAGTVLFREDDVGDKLYVIQTGRVKITKAVHDQTKTLAILGAGEFLGEMAILNQKPRTATAEVVEDAELLVLDGKTLQQMVVSNAEIAVRLIKKLARRLDGANQLIEILMHEDPKARVILGLSREAAVSGVKRDDGTVSVPLDSAGLAQQVGLPVSAVDGVLNRVVRLGIIVKHPDSIEVSDVERLHEFLEFLEMQQKYGDA